MILKEFNYYLKKGTTLEEIQGPLIKKVNRWCDPFTGYIAHVYDTVLLKHWIIASDNVVELYKLDKNILLFNDFQMIYDRLDKIEEALLKDDVKEDIIDRLDKVEENLSSIQNEFNDKKDELSHQEKLKEQLEQEISQLDKKIEEAKEYVDELKANLDSKSSELNSRIDSVNSDLTNIIDTKANTDAVINLTDNQTINGIKTFSAVPVVATQPTNANQVANKAYVDSVASLNKSSPNYKGRISIPSTTTSYTAPSNGFLIVSAVNLGANGSNESFNDFSLSINSIVLAAYVAHSGMSSDRNFHFSAPLKKGDVVAGLVPLGHYGTGTITKTFIPYQ